MKLTKRDAIERLYTVVSHIPFLETQKSFGEDFKKWRHDVRALLKHVFPNDNDYIKDFDDISYTLLVCTTETPESAFEGAYRSGLGSARAMLRSRIDEVTQFWPDLEGVVKSDGTSNGPAHPELVFVIHGRQLLSDFHAFLRALGLKPFEWSKARNLTGKTNLYTWEIVDKALMEAGAIVALLTPDDEARLDPRLYSEHESILERDYMSQPRQNVLFEAGVAYGRDPRRTILVRVGSHRPISDLAGHHILQLDDSPQSRQAVADALSIAGCPVDMTGAEWFQSGKFSLTEQPERTRNVTEKTHAESDELREAVAQLLLLRTRLRGFTDLLNAAAVVTEIHNFFAKHPKHLNAASIVFLEKYPENFSNKVRFAPHAWPSLDEIKRDAQSLHIGIPEARTLGNRG
jgi:predicted nucleotide-binding protein